MTTNMIRAVEVRNRVDEMLYFLQFSGEYPDPSTEQAKDAPVSADGHELSIEIVANDRSFRHFLSRVAALTALMQARWQYFAQFSGEDPFQLNFDEGFHRIGDGYLYQSALMKPRLFARFYAQINYPLP